MKEDHKNSLTKMAMLLLKIYTQKMSVKNGVNKLIRISN